MRVAVLFALAILTSPIRAEADDVAAERSYVEGQGAYDVGDYATAIVKWETAYQLSGASGLLFNIAQAQRLAGHCTAAIASYRHFLEVADPRADQRTLAEDLERELEARCGEKAPSRREDPLPQKIAAADVLHDHRDPTPSQEGGHSLRVTAVAFGGAGLVLVAAGLYLDHRGGEIADDVSAACHTSCAWSAWSARDADGRRDVAVGRGIVVGGVLAVAAGGVLYYLGRRGAEVAIAPEGHGLAASWSTRW